VSLRPIADYNNPNVLATGSANAASSTPPWLAVFDCVTLRNTVDPDPFCGYSAKGDWLCL